MLRRLIDYDPATGEMRWKERPVWMFAARPKHRARVVNSWNKKYSGKPCFSSKDFDGYLFGSLFWTNYKAHRVAYAWFHGNWPKGHIDHINGIRSDNRINNLRDVSRSQNQMNMGAPSDNTSGVVGVCWNRRKSLWVSSITAYRRTYHLGYYERFEDAVAARKAAEIKHGFHPNHGRNFTTSRRPK